MKLRVNVPQRNWKRVVGALASGFLLLAWPFSGIAQELLYQETFNDDGEVANPPRYTTTGRAHFEPAEFEAAGVPTTQLGPVYWAHNFEVSFVGVPGPTPARRAILAWDGAITSDQVSDPAKKLLKATFDWLLKGKTGAKVVISPTVDAAPGLADLLTAAGHTVTDDDTALADTAIVADLIIKAPGGDDSRFGKVPKPVLAFSATSHDDMLLSTIGTTATFTAGQATIVTASHPAAAGLTGSFDLVTGEHTWQLIGDQLPEGSITVANFTEKIPPTAASLADVDAMVSGKNQSTQASATVTTLDFSANSTGNWPNDNEIPGAPTGIWGLVAKGKLNVSAAGKYSFGLGMDDGARLRIDKDKNGFTDADNVIVEDAAGGHRARYGDVTFATAGTYDFEVTAFNSGGAGDVELSVSTKANGGDTSAIDSGSWELLGETTGKVSLSGTISATSYVPAGPDTERVIPFLVLLNGPDEGGSVFGGGPFVGFEGRGFFAGSALNKFPPDISGLGGFRSVQLRPVRVTGKQNVKLTVGLAATFLDFETSDFLDIIVFPNGVNSSEVRLAHFSAPSDSKKYFVDTLHGNSNQLGLRFKDVSFDVPAGATDLVIEFRAFTSWWNETVAFDNVRVTAGALTPQLSITRDGGSVRVEFTGVLQSAAQVTGGWADVANNPSSPFVIPPAQQAKAQFFRARAP